MNKISIILLIILSTFYSCKTAIVDDATRPNILFFLIDDQRNDVLSCAGHSIVETPVIDGLAKRGVMFTRAYVTTSICAASRASILTGLYECKHNYTFGKPPLQMEFLEESYPLLLRKAGYNTGFIGKLGVNLEKQDSILSEMFDYCSLSPSSVPYIKTYEDDSTRHSAEIKGEKAIEYIQNQSPDKPFCLSVSFNAVHAVDGNLKPGLEGHYPYSKSVANLYENVSMPAPVLSDPGIYENHPDFLKTSMNRERYFWRWDTDEKYQVNMKAYLRMISTCDKVIGEVIDALAEAGLADNTIIIYSADNGYYMGDRGFAGKWTHYEESLRVPMIIADPRSEDGSRGKTSDDMVLNIDIPATILEFAGVPVPSGYQGKSFVKLISGKNADDWRKSFLIEHRMEHYMIPKYVGIHGERYVYATYYEQQPPYEFLHDLLMDPDQLMNLVNDSEYYSLLQQHRNKSLSLEESLTKK